MAERHPEIVSIGCNRPHGCWHIASHAHDLFEMVVITGGREDVAVAGRRFCAAAGDVLLFAPGVAHEEWSAARDTVQSYFLTFKAADASEWPLLSSDRDGRMRLLASWLYAGRDARDRGRQPVDRAFFQALTRHRENPLVESVRAYVRQNIAAVFSVDRLAAHSGMSKFHFIRRYHQLAGRSPMDDVRMIRVGHARDLILTSSLPLKAIAPLAGIGDEISLYRLFRRYLGMTPGQLRRSVRAQRLPRAGRPA
jgi:AraC-like DNA-binding protein